MDAFLRTRWTISSEYAAAAAAATVMAAATATVTVASKTDHPESASSGKRIAIIIDQLPVDCHDRTDIAPPALTLTIRDHGIGIPIQDLPRIFDPFFTGENAIGMTLAEFEKTLKERGKLYE